MKNLVEYREETDYEWNNQTGTLGDVLNLGDGYAYGADLLIRNEWNNFSGFVGYSYGITKKKIESTNIDPETGEEQYYYPKYDKTHTINIVEKYSMRDLFNLDGDKDLFLGVNYTFATGQPFSKLEHIYLDNSNLSFIYGYKDSGRLPNYSRCDLSLTYRREYKHLSIEPYLQIINIFNHKNVWFRNYEAKQQDNSGNIAFDYEDVYMFPLIPFIGINVMF
jgi:hypothetical protein